MWYNTIIIGNGGANFLFCFLVDFFIFWYIINFIIFGLLGVLWLVQKVQAVTLEKN